MGLWMYLERGGLRADECAHRRWGKDDVSLHWTATAAHRRIGVYWHMLPEANQARKAIWDAINPNTGKKRIDEAFPTALRKVTRQQDMYIEFKCGSSWQVVGSDNFNSLVGSPPIGVIFSEWALADPGAWTYIRPILAQNGGWAIFIWTPRGRNHATRAWEARAKDPTWFTQKMPATKTPVFTPAQLEKERQELIDEAGSKEEGEAIYRTEYLVDFDAPVPGAYFGEQINLIQEKGQICRVPYDRQFKVSTMWDLGMDDYTSIWFFQRVSPRRFNIIDFYETGDVGLDVIVPEAFRTNDKKHWQYDMHYLPHDVEVRELGAGGRSRRESLHQLGMRPIRVGVARDPAERINASRKMLPFCWFDEKKCAEGIEHLKQYRKNFNKSLGVYTGPKHDKHSHASDAFGEGAVNARLPEEKDTKRGRADENIQKDRWWNKRRSGLLTPPNWKVV